MSRRLPTALALLLAAGTAVAPATADQHQHSKYDAVVTSFDGTRIAVSVYRPGGASASTPVPMILHSHGWGGSRTSSPTAFRTELDRGYGVLSIDQRGHGATGGTAYVQDPDYEGRDIMAVIDYVASLDWVAKDTETVSASPLPSQAPDRADEQSRRPGGGEQVVIRENDPVLFAMGGSYGGGYQLVGALTEVMASGYTRFNALAPEITWFDLPESLAPSAVTRTAWVAALYAAGLNKHHPDVHAGFAYGASTGQWPDGSVPGVPNVHARFHRNGPVGFVEQGVHLDIPVLFRQGLTDNLFNLNQGWHNFERTLTASARERSVLIGYNGGHALPNVAPAGYGESADACSPGGFSALRLAFFDEVRAGGDPRDLVGGLPYHLTTAGARCVRLASLSERTTMQTELAAPVSAATTTGAGVPQHLLLAPGPMTVAGVPLAEFDVTSAGVDQRVFFALSVGATPATARVVQNNMMPLRELLPVTGQRRTVELPGIAVDVPAGENLYLTVSPVSDMSFGHGSARTPGVVTLENISVRVPVVS